jgi:hypothetical protein
VPAVLTTSHVPGLTYDEQRAINERAKIIATLDKHNGNKSEAAAAMGMARRTFYRRLMSTASCARRDGRPGDTGEHTAVDARPRARSAARSARCDSGRGLPSPAVASLRPVEAPTPARCVPTLRRPRAGSCSASTSLAAVHAAEELCSSAMRAASSPFGVTATHSVPATTSHASVPDGRMAHGKVTAGGVLG